MNNEQIFFKNLLNMEMTPYSVPLTEKEVERIYLDVATKDYEKPLFEFAKRLEQAHLIGVYHDKR